MNPYEEKLRRMLEAGRLTPEQYEELRSTLPGAAAEGAARAEEARAEAQATPPSHPPSPLTGASAASPENQDADRRPWQILLCALFLFTVGGWGLLQSSPSRTGAEGTVLIGSLIILAAGYGILKRLRWVYAALAIIAPVALTADILQDHLSAFILNGIFACLLLNAWEFFYPGRSPGEAIEDGYLWLRRIQPQKRGQAHPRPVLLLGVLLILMAVFALFRGLALREWLPGLGQASPLIMRFWFHEFLLPAQGLGVAVIDLVFCTLILKQNRIAYMILAGFTAWELLADLGRYDFIGLFLQLPLAGLLAWAWKYFIARQEEETDRMEETEEISL